MNDDRPTDTEQDCAFCPEDHPNPATREWICAVSPDEDDDGRHRYMVIATILPSHVTASDARWVMDLIAQADPNVLQQLAWFEHHAHEQAAQIAARDARIVEVERQLRANIALREEAEYVSELALARANACLDHYNVMRQEFS